MSVRPLRWRLLRDVVELIVIYLYELTVSSLVVARTALARDPRISSSIIAVPIALRSDTAIAVLACLVSLTPGNCALHVSDDRRWLYIHALDGRAPDEIIDTIKRLFESRLARIEQW